jgi:hypothetical protein
MPALVAGIDVLGVRRTKMEVTETSPASRMPGAVETQRQLVRAFEPVLQRDRVVVALVACGVEEGDRPMLGAFAQIGGRRFGGLLPELVPIGFDERGP